MDSQQHSKTRDAYAAWNTANDKLRRQERLVSSALELYASGQGELPQAMIDEVHAMRADCNAKFQAMLAAMRQGRDGQ